MSSLKLWKNKIVKISRFFLVFAVITAWLFTGWPQIWQNPRIPPKIQEVRAASPEIFAIDGTFTASTGIYAVTVECWGGGGAGHELNNSGGGGGGGGAYAKSTNVAVVPGTGYPVDIGAAGAPNGGNGVDSTFNTTTVVADGGTGASTSTGGAGGTTANSTGNAIESAGGKGGNGDGTADAGGGGGGAGGPNGAGLDGQNGNYGSSGYGGAGGDSNQGVGAGDGGAGQSGNVGLPGGTDTTYGGGGGGGGDDGKAGGQGGAPGGGGGGGGDNEAIGGAGENGQCIISYTDTWAPSTALATYSNTWSFATAPNNASASQIDMVATTGYDYTTINYLFTLDSTDCGSDAGTGGTTSSWQASTSYSDTGLDANKCYGYTVQARDTTPNTGTASSRSKAYTSANTPGTPTLTGATLTTLNLTNAENSNPAANPTTNFAVQVTYTSPSDATWLDQWVDASGNPSATAVWLTDAQLDALVLQGLDPGVTYGVKVKAKNEDGDETSLSAEGQGTTTAAIISVTITTEDKTVPYGILDFEGVKSTIDLSKTKTAQNNGNVAEDFTIKTSAATGGMGWALGSSAGENVFVHEFSSNGGGVWTKFTTADEYSLTPLVTNIGVGTTQNFDLRITAPNPSSDAVQKDITITVRAAQY